MTGGSKLKGVEGFSNEGIQLGIVNWGVGKADENILIKRLIHTSREKDGKTFDGLAIIFFTKPQKFIEICLSYCMDEQGELIEDLRKFMPCKRIQLPCKLSSFLCWGCHTPHTPVFSPLGRIVQLQIVVYLQPLFSATWLFLYRSAGFHLLYTITIAGSNGLYTIAL